MMIMMIWGSIIWIFCNLVKWCLFESFSSVILFGVNKVQYNYIYYLSSCELSFTHIYAILGEQHMCVYFASLNVDDKHCESSF